MKDNTRGDEKRGGNNNTMKLGKRRGEEMKDEQKRRGKIEKKEHKKGENMKMK